MQRRSRGLFKTAAFKDKWKRKRLRIVNDNAAPPPHHAVCNLGFHIPPLHRLQTADLYYGFSCSGSVIPCPHHSFKVQSLHFHNELLSAPELWSIHPFNHNRILEKHNTFVLLWNPSCKILNSDRLRYERLSAVFWIWAKVSGGLEKV